MCFLRSPPNQSAQSSVLLSQDSPKHELLSDFRADRALWKSLLIHQSNQSFISLTGWTIQEYLHSPYPTISTYEHFYGLLYCIFGNCNRKSGSGPGRTWVTTALRLTIAVMVVALPFAWRVSMMGGRCATQSWSQAGPLHLPVSTLALSFAKWL